MSTSIEQISLPQTYREVPVALVCRTCSHQDNRYWHTSKLSMISRLASGESRQDIACSPDETLKVVKVLETIRSKGRVVPVNKVSDKPTRAVVDSCGQSLLPKCKSCDRLVPTQVAIPYSKVDGVKIHWVTQTRNGEDTKVPQASDGGTVSWWNATIGGHCSIPVEGIEKDGGRVFCDPQPRKLKIENPACGNCHWLDFTGEQWQFDYLRVNDNAALTPWEKEQAKSLMNQDVNYPMALGIKLKAKQQQAIGRKYWYRAELLKEGWHKGTYKYKVLFDESRCEAILGRDDPRWTVHPTENPTIVGVEISMPHHKLFGLGDHLYRRPLKWPKLPKAVRQSTDTSSLRSEICHDCARMINSQACYFHAKVPVTSDLTGETNFMLPELKTTTWVYPPEGQLKVSRHNGAILAIDGNGAIPKAYSKDVANASVFRLHYHSLLIQARKEFGPEGVAAIEAQYKALKASLRRSNRGTPSRPSWLSNGGTEPSKPRCSHPGGLNLRSVFQDSFGAERTDWFYDQGAANQMATAEELRVGYRQHELTPQRLQEEIISTDLIRPNYDNASGAVISQAVTMPEVWVTIKLRGVGGMTREDGSYVESTEEFLDRLDDEVMVGQSGETDRFMSKRMQMFGYDLSRGFFGKRKGADKTSVPSRDRDMIIFGDSTGDDRDVSTDWRCVECEKSYTQDEIEDYFFPVCSCGADLYKTHLAREVPNPRASGGVGNAYVMDSENSRQRQRLGATICPNWALKGATHITLDSLSGSERNESTSPQTEEDPVTVVKLKTLALTDEQREHNIAYWAKNEDVVQRRTDFLLEFPETTQVELIQKFPRPKGVIYQVTSAGSLAKVGSM